MATKYGIQKRGTGKAINLSIGGVSNIYGNIAQGIPGATELARTQQSMFPSETNLKSQGNFQTATGQSQQAAASPTKGPDGVVFRPLSPVTSKKGGMTKKKKK
jgi:hypothetical protein